MTVLRLTNRLGLACLLVACGYATAHALAHSERKPPQHVEQQAEGDSPKHYDCAAEAGLTVEIVPALSVQGVDGGPPRLEVDVVAENHEVEDH
jgi:hypothetical protein